MKKFYYFATVAIILIGCGKIEKAISNLELRMDAIEGTAISTVDKQITAINASLETLKSVDESLQGLIDILEKEDENLKKADSELSKKITDLETYIESEINFSKDWADATFATLEQYAGMQEEIAAIRLSIEKYNTDITAAYVKAISDAIEASEKSMKGWVNATLAESYYDIATIDAMLKELSSDLDDADSALRNDLQNQRTALENAKQELRTEWESAISFAIYDNNGFIDEKIINALKEPNEKIQHLEQELIVLTDRFARRIQSLVFLPQYNDGKVKIDFEQGVTLDFVISPARLADDLKTAFDNNSSIISGYARYTEDPATRTVNLINLTVTGLETGDNGIISICLSAQNLSKKFWKGDIEAVTFIKITDNNGNDIISDCIPMYGDAPLFSVSASKMVIFSKGNLQHHPLNGLWRFAENQYDCIGADNANISTSYDGWIDLFGWSSTKYNYGVSSSTDYNDYYGDFVDWGKLTIGNYAPQTWRTITVEEYEYLSTGRTEASNLLGCAMVNGVTGLILLPDDWKCPSEVTFNPGFYSGVVAEPYAFAEQNNYTAEEWASLEKAGAVFLPSAGFRYETSVTEGGVYWTATRRSDHRNERSHTFSFNSTTTGTGNMANRDGYAVRLIRDIE